MNCERVGGLLAVYRELDRSERRAVAEHLRRCETCRAAWRDEQYLVGLFASEADLAPPRALEARLLAIPHGAGMVPALRRWGVGRPLLGALLITGVVGLMRGGVTPTQTAGVRGPATEGAPIGAPTRVARERIPLLYEGAATAARPAESEPAPDVVVVVPYEPEPMAAAVVPEATVPRAAVGGRSEAREGPRATAVPSPAPTASPEPCVVVFLHAFADVAGEAGGACPGCDGVFNDEDAAEARRRGLALPGFQIAAYDASGTVLFEQAVPPGGVEAALTLPALCGRLPLTVQVVGLGGGWAPCAGHGLEVEIGAPGRATVVLPLTPGCPGALAPEPLTSPSALPPAAATPGAQP